MDFWAILQKKLLVTDSGDAGGDELRNYKCRLFFSWAGQGLHLWKCVGFTWRRESMHAVSAQPKKGLRKQWVMSMARYKMWLFVSVINCEWNQPWAWLALWSMVSGQMWTPSGMMLLSRELGQWWVRTIGNTVSDEPGPWQCVHLCPKHQDPVKSPDSKSEAYLRCVPIWG